MKMLIRQTAIKTTLHIGKGKGHSATGLDRPKGFRDG